MYQGFAARTLSTQIGFEIDDDWFEPASQPLSLMTDPDTELFAKTALVCSPIVLLGDGAPVIPFGTYDLVFSSGQTSPIGTETAIRAALVGRDGGEPITISAQQLDALARDPDVEII
jgi:hypothetical protein